MRPRRLDRCARVTIGIAAALLFGLLAAAEPAVRPLALGLQLDAGSPPPAISTGSADRPLDVRLAVDWSAIESAVGAYDWSAIAPTITALTERHARITLCVRGDNPLHPAGDRKGEAPQGDWLEAWNAVVRSAVRTFPGSIATIEIGERPEKDWGPNVYAFVLKSSALAARAEAKAAGTSVRVAQGAVDADSLEWERALLAADAAAYIDALPIVVTGGDPSAAIQAFQEAVLEHPPAPEIRVYAEPPEGAGPWESFRIAVAALASGAPVALASLPADPSIRDRAAATLSGLAGKLADGYAPAPTGGLAVTAPDGSPSAGAALYGRFLHVKDFATLVVYDAPPTGGTETQARLVLDTIDVKDPVVIDPPTGAEYKTGPAQVPGISKRALRILLADHPMAVAWERVSENVGGIDIGPQDIQVASTRGLTAQEIIARNQEVQKVQDDRLQRWTADGRIDFHYKLAQGGSSLDISIESHYFWHKGGELEWEQTRYYINGNVVTWKKIPELPLVQPEKVLTLPLDLTFDKTYDYRLAGEDTVGGRPAYVLAFEPAAGATGTSLYSGRVWIDKESFVRLKTSVVQSGLDPPVISNEEADTYVPVTGPDGAVYTMIGRVSGQQLWSFAGRNFVVHREVSFSNFAINPSAEDFQAAVSTAYASNNQVLRDTDKGFRYLEKDKTGTREVRDALKTSALFLAAGAFKDDSISSVVPLAGVNWLDYDWLKKKIQVEAFFAGAYAYANLTDPSIGGSKADVGGEVSLIAIKLDDKLFVDGTEDVAQRVRRRSQYLTGRVGYPLGSFVKLSAIGDLTWNQYTGSSDANDALAAQNAQNGTNLTFVLPANHEVYAGTLQIEFNRNAYSVTAAGSYSRRSSWAPWGLFDQTGQTFENPDYDPSQKSFETWSLTAFKEWYFPKFQKFRLEADYLGGSNLDRFSQYQFGTFGEESLVGYSGTGVRFDTGYIARAGWSFNILNAVRFSLSAENGWVRDSLEDDRLRSHLGAGLSFNVVGPWKTVWQGSYGRAMRSDIPELEGKQEFLLVILKLF